MPTLVAHSHRTSTGDRQTRLQHAAAVTSAVIAVMYLLISTGVLSVGRSSSGELGILGFAAGVFAILAVLLWYLTSRLLWAATAVLQVLVIWAYLAIAAERDPAFELWGVSIRLLQATLLATLVALLVDVRRSRRARS